MIVHSPAAVTTRVRRIDERSLTVNHVRTTKKAVIIGGGIDRPGAELLAAPGSSAYLATARCDGE